MQANVQNCVVNGMPLMLPEEFISMFGHCRVAEHPPTFLVETEHMSWLVERLPKGGCAVDIGASGGLFTAAFALRCGGKGKVWSFEPAKGARTLLETTVERNILHNVEIRPFAISDTAGTATFYEMPRTADCAWRPETSAMAVHSTHPDMMTYDVEVTTIDSCLPPDSTIDVMKIDIEGFEAHALRGGVKTIARSHPAICVDIHRRIEGEGDTSEDVRAILKPLGYSFEQRGHVLFCTP